MLTATAVPSQTQSVSPTGRPEGEHRSAQHEGRSIDPTGRPEGEHRSAQHEGRSIDPTGRPEGEHRSAQHEGRSIDPTGRPEGERRSAQHEGRASQPELQALKARQQGAWSAGNYAVIGTTLQIVGEELCETLDVRSGTKVLDVAAGNGNAALAAARRWAKVTATDYVPSLLEQARARAVADGLDIEFRQADAEALPFADGEFDVVMSTFGVMFTPDQEKAAAELLRVCRGGGKIGLANWTPESFIGQLFKTIGKYVPPAAGVKSPALWGTAGRIQELFGHDAESIRAEPRTFAFRYRSAEHWLHIFRTYYGPVLKTFGALDDPAQAALTHDILALIARFDRGGPDAMVAPSEYLEVVITRR